MVYEEITTAIDNLSTAICTKLENLNTTFTSLNTKMDNLLTKIDTIGSTLGDLSIISATLIEVKNLFVAQLANFDINTGNMSIQSNNLTQLEAMEQRLIELNEKLEALKPAFSESGPQSLAQNVQDLRDITKESFEDTKRLMKKAGLK
jgi:hypothetical protein